MEAILSLVQLQQLVEVEVEIIVLPAEKTEVPVVVPTMPTLLVPVPSDKEIMVEQHQLQLQITVQVEGVVRGQSVGMVRQQLEETVEMVYHLTSEDMMSFMVAEVAEAHIVLELRGMEVWVVEELDLQETPQMEPKILVEVEVELNELGQQEEPVDQALL